MGQIFDIPEEHIQNVLDKYETHLSQLQVCEEECSELIKAISKHIRSLQKTTTVTTEAARMMIVEETAHVAIACGMLAKIFDISQYEIESEVKKKVSECGFDDSNYSYASLDFTNASKLFRSIHLPPLSAEDLDRAFDALLNAKLSIFDDQDGDDETSTS